MTSKTDTDFSAFIAAQKANLARIVEKATDVLGDEARAIDWIDHVSGTLGDTPRALAATDEGTNAVLLHLGGISRHSLN